MHKGIAAEHQVYSDMNIANSEDSDEMAHNVAVKAIKYNN